jgi:hypothetical protein
MLFEANPEANKVQENDGDLPLNHALYIKASDDIIKIQYEANYPEANKVQNLTIIATSFSSMLSRLL